MTPPLYHYVALFESFEMIPSPSTVTLSTNICPRTKYGRTPNLNSPVNKGRFPHMPCFPVGGSGGVGDDLL